MTFEPVTLPYLQPSWLKKWKLSGPSMKRKKAVNCRRLLLAYKASVGVVEVGVVTC